MVSQESAIKEYLTSDGPLISVLHDHQPNDLGRSEIPCGQSVSSMTCSDFGFGQGHQFFSNNLEVRANKRSALAEAQEFIENGRCTQSEAGFTEEDDKNLPIKDQAVLAKEQETLREMRLRSLRSMSIGGDAMSGETYSNDTRDGKLKNSKSESGRTVETPNISNKSGQRRSSDTSASGENLGTSMGSISASGENRRTSIASGENRRTSMGSISEEKQNEAKENNKYDDINMSRNHEQLMAEHLNKLDEEKQIGDDVRDIAPGATCSRRDLSSRESKTDYYTSDDEKVTFTSEEIKDKALGAKRTSKQSAVSAESKPDAARHAGFARRRLSRRFSNPKQKEKENSLNMEGKLLWTCEMDKTANKATDYLENEKNGSKDVENEWEWKGVSQQSKNDSSQQSDMDYVVCALPMEGLTDLEREVIQVKLELAQVKASLDEEKLARMRAEEGKYRLEVFSRKLSEQNNSLEQVSARYQAENARLNVAANECEQLKRDVSILSNELDQSKKVLTLETEKMTSEVHQVKTDSKEITVVLQHMRANAVNASFEREELRRNLNQIIEQRDLLQSLSIELKAERDLLRYDVQKLSRENNDINSNQDAPHGDKFSRKKSIRLDNIFNCVQTAAANSTRDIFRSSMKKEGSEASRATSFSWSRGSQSGSINTGSWKNTNGNAYDLSGPFTEETSQTEQNLNKKNNINGDTKAGLSIPSNQSMYAGNVPDCNLPLRNCC